MQFLHKEVSICLTTNRGFSIPCMTYYACYIIDLSLFQDPTVIDTNVKDFVPAILGTFQKFALLPLEQFVGIVKQGLLNKFLRFDLALKITVLYLHNSANQDAISSMLAELATHAIVIQDQTLLYSNHIV